MKLFSTIKSFYFDNMKLIHKFLLNQFALSIFGMMVCVSISAFSDTAMFVASVLASLFFVSLLYDSAWDEGARDRNRVTNGRLPLRPLHGAKVALFAYIPTLVFLIPSLISSFLRLADIHFLDPIEWVGKWIVLFFCNGTYLGIAFVANEIPMNNGYDVSMFISVLFLLPAIAAYALGYRLGLADKQIKTLFGMAPALGDGAKKEPKNKK